MGCAPNFDIISQLCPTFGCWGRLRPFFYKADKNLSLLRTTSNDENKIHREPSVQTEKSSRFPEWAMQSKRTLSKHVPSASWAACCERQVWKRPKPSCLLHGCVASIKRTDERLNPHFLFLGAERKPTPGPSHCLTCPSIFMNVHTCFPASLKHCLPLSSGWCSTSIALQTCARSSISLLHGGEPSLQTILDQKGYAMHCS